MIQKALKTKGRSRSIDEIKQGINVMSKCHLTFSKGGKELWRGAILQDLVTVGREEYLASTDTSSHSKTSPLH
jgi:hypothetical protein